MASPAALNPMTEVVEFFACAPSREAIAAFRLSPAAQERIRDQMRQEERKMREEYRHGQIDDLLKPENQTPHFKELAKEFDKLIAEQRQILVKNEFDRIYSGEGGSRVRLAAGPLPSQRTF